MHRYIFRIVQLMVVGPPGLRYQTVQCLVEEKVYGCLKGIATTQSLPMEGILVWGQNT